ncbi:MAG: ribosomal L7Ae/L30e/S12e/Gadd45 family protein [Lachnospiraceae bacterium]|nr:ribosomal L7Ae/L30e/S12e/Gadd45 family protein [Lachnospiraceae bacterium]MDE7260206.1 ribosomal L7Ae/L30e/S12e/Gadd45 family protein [Lachnospiraceae bacterium]
MQNRPNKDRVLSMLGLATRSRNVVSGGFATEEAVKSGKACLVIIAEDASDNTRKKYSNMCEFYEVPYEYYSVKEILGHAIGKEERSCLAVTDKGFADSIQKHLLDSR